LRATSLSAKSRKGNEARPLGGVPQHIAIRCASSSPSSLVCLVLGYAFRFNVASNQTETNRLRSLTTLLTLISKVLAISSFDQDSPSSPASAFSNILAVEDFFADTLVLEIRDNSS